MIDERIAALTAEKEEMHKDYLSADSAEQNVIAMCNMRISMELKFLSELKQALGIDGITERDHKAIKSVCDHSFSPFTDGWQICTKCDECKTELEIVG